MKELLLVIDKVPGPTSFDVVRDVKRILGGEKVGHTGSLDPFASGVLVLLSGRATKLSNALLNADKSYHAIVKLGEETDTMDRTGKVNQSLPVPELTLDDVKAVLKGFEGEWLQTPPMYSAKKIKGVRLYRLARKNISVEREPIPVQLYEMKFISYEAPYLAFEVRCSKGTYIRSLADEIGKRLKTVGHLAELRRLTCGAFSLADSVTLEGLTVDLPHWMRKGGENYGKLLRAEGYIGKPLPVRMPQFREPIKGPNRGTSFANAKQEW